jgi:hypothetical protein
MFQMKPRTVSKSTPAGIVIHASIAATTDAGCVWIKNFVSVIANRSTKAATHLYR